MLSALVNEDYPMPETQPVQADNEYSTLDNDKGDIFAGFFDNNEADDNKKEDEAEQEESASVIVEY